MPEYQMDEGFFSAGDSTATPGVASIAAWVSVAAFSVLPVGMVAAVTRGSVPVKKRIVQLETSNKSKGNKHTIKWDWKVNL